MSSYMFRSIANKFNNEWNNEKIAIYAVLDCQFISVMVSLNLTSYECLYAKKYLKSNDH